MAPFDIDHLGVSPLFTRHACVLTIIFNHHQKFVAEIFIFNENNDLLNSLDIEDRQKAV
ncbi:20330_t:CDS:2 [Funneliformis geosporum]|nr:20330_t:CDS:2 [Funneliformis geosporum]